ncbi:group 1 glycosyl transferase [Planococcus antarcticus DSM 14505]|uniref:Group 1 glycosyl transferase n=1 Tax=Planococcus antarcticus DSM 14505 TaxID=1185653 RepID=A0AA87LRX3_9BACL|nr:glycosyltransferase family 1 protein [Planococcus antarcticus]EIM05714.1 group 1 glycosyl transferase [Planococcus antarcticus DSM 14505]
MKPIRVLQVLASLNRGGAEAMIMNLYRNIDRSKVQFDFVVNDSSEKYSYEREIEKMGGKVFRVPRYTVTNYASYKKAWEELIIHHPEWKIIHGHHTSPAFIYLHVAKRLKRITIAHSHIAGGEKTLKSYFKSIIRYPTRYTAEYLFACSESAAEWMFGNKSSRAYVLNNSIEAKKFIYSESTRKEKREELGIEKKFVIGHVGRFQTQKNHSFIIDIFKTIHEKNDDAILLLVGEGELRTVITEKVEKLGLTNYVIFTGVRADIPELLQAMDLFLFPSLYEGLGMVAIEAQAAGLPCIVADTIPKEAFITNLIESVSLKEPGDFWGKKILRYKEIDYQRLNRYEEIKSKKYDIGETSKWLEDFYISSWKV